MNKLNFVKAAVSLVVGSGISHIVKEIVDKNVESENTMQRIFVVAGRRGLSMVINDITKSHTDAKIDAAATWLQATFSK